MLSDVVPVNMFFHATRRRYLDMYRLRRLHYYFLSDSRYHYSFWSLTILNMAFLIVLILSTILLYQSLHSPQNQDNTSNGLKARQWALIIVYFFPVIGWLLICCFGITTTMVQDRMYHLLSRKCTRNIVISLCSFCPIFLAITVMILFAPYYSVYGVY